MIEQNEKNKKVKWEYLLFTNFRMSHQIVEKDKKLQKQNSVPKAKNDQNRAGQRR